MPVRSAPFSPDDCGRPWPAWRDEKHWLWATREAWGSDACADVGSLSQLAGQLQIPLRLCIDAGDEASRFDVWQVIHRRQPRCQPMAIVTPLPLGWRWEAGGMTHVVNLLPRRDLRRRQRLRYVLLLTIGIVLLGGMGLLVSRTARLQRDFPGDASHDGRRAAARLA